MKKKNIMILIAAFLLLAAVLIGWNIWTNRSERKAAQFVAQNGAEFSELVNSGQAIPKTFNGVTIDVWNGKHIMYEFLLGLGIGEHQYWGVYYSPDDVPLPFQNTDAFLLANGEKSWRWQETHGDNHGTTRKITEKWYYFEASF